MARRSTTEGYPDREWSYIFGDTGTKIFAAIEASLCAIGRVVKKIYKSLWRFYPSNWVYYDLDSINNTYELSAVVDFFRCFEMEEPYPVWLYTTRSGKGLVSLYGNMAYPIGIVNPSFLEKILTSSAEGDNIGVPENIDGTVVFKISKGFMPW